MGGENAKFIRDWQLAKPWVATLGIDYQDWTSETIGSDIMDWLSKLTSKSMGSDIMDWLAKLVIH